MEEIPVEHLKSEIDKLKFELNEKEKAFSVKRAQFKELYLQKEGELKSLTDNYNLSMENVVKLKAEVNSLKTEIGEINRTKEAEDEERGEKGESVLAKIAQRVRLNTQEVLRVWKEEGVLQGEGEGEELRMLKEKIREAYRRIDELEAQFEGGKGEKYRIKREKIDKTVKNIDLKSDLVGEIGKKGDLVMFQSRSGENLGCLDELEGEKREKYQINKGKSDKLMKNSDLKSDWVDEIDKKEDLVTSDIQSVENLGCVGEVEEDRERNMGESHLNKDKIEKSMKNTDFEGVLVISKSQSGDNLGCIGDLEGDKGDFGGCKRRNTDVESLKDFRIVSGGDSVSRGSGRGGERVVSEKEWSRLHLELSALKNKSLGSCEMCKNYEDQLQSLQDKFKSQVNDYNALSDENQANLRLILTIRESNNKLSCQLNDTAEGHEKTIIDLSSKFTNLNDFCDRLRIAYERFRDSTDKELKNIVHERRDVKMKMEKIESAYENLLGIRGKKAAELEAEEIDLPTDIETAQFHLLTLKEEIIQFKSANEHLNEKIQSLEVFNKEKEIADNEEKESILEEYNKERKELTSKNEYLTIELNKLIQSQKFSENLEETLRVIKVELETVKKNYVNLENENKIQKKKCYALQQELENSESVQQDFVRLSQTLQIQLEKIRQEEKELRWQFKDDVLRCNECQQYFQSNNNLRNKHNCRHCGKVFCKPCLSEILSGPNSRKAEVCKVCHTMLVKDAAPYFSINKQ